MDNEKALECFFYALTERKNSSCIIKDLVAPISMFARDDYLTDCGDAYQTLLFSCYFNCGMLACGAVIFNEATNQNLFHRAVNNDSIILGGNIMKKRLLAFLCAIVLMIGLMPVTAFAALPDGVPSSLEAPTIKNIELKKDGDGVPYFEAQVKIPQSVLGIDGEKPAGGSVFWGWAVKVDNGSWSDFGGGGYLDVVVETEESRVPGSNDTFYITFDPIDEGKIDEIDIKAHTYSYKIQLSFDYYEGWPNVKPIYSSASNEISIGTGSFYAKASAWAETKLQKADALGLIPDILKGADLTKPITREEFCELSVLLYEKVTGKASEPISPNPFNDTANEQILKANKIGITTGTSATTFSPKALINREQCAAMLFRAIKAIKPDGDFSIAGVKDFPDQKYISAYAIDAAKYMLKAGILTGDAKGNFMPKATTSAQEAAGYGMATREQAIALSVTTYEKIK